MSVSPSFFTSLDATQISYRKPRRVKRVGHYALGRVLGEGSYGKVKEGVDLESKDRVAVKIFSMARLAKLPGAQALVTRELALLRQLRHSHIVHARDDFALSAKAKHYVVMEYVGGGTLQRLLEQHAPTQLPLMQTRHILKGIAKALAHLEEARVVHRDIKPDNILLTEDGDAKLSDFGVALQLRGERWDELDAAQLGEGSLAYQPPECHEGAKTVRPSGSREGSEAAFEGSRGAVSPAPTSPPKRKRKRPAWMRHPFKVDVWSLGVVLYVMVMGRFPFPNDNLLALFAAIADGAYSLPSDLDPTLAALLRGMLCVDAAQRFDARTVLKHAWLSSKLPKEKRLKCKPLDSAFGQSRDEMEAVLEAALDHSVSNERHEEATSEGRASATRSGTGTHSSQDDTSDSATPLSGSFGDDDEEEGAGERGKGGEEDEEGSPTAAPKRPTQRGNKGKPGKGQRAQERTHKGERTKCCTLL